jgi:hypothetical protein
VWYPTCPPVDPGANEEGDKNIPCEVPVGAGAKEQGTGTRGSVTSAIEKLAKSKGVVKESIVTRELNKKKSYAIR